MNLGILAQSLALSYMAYKTDWDKQVKIASERLQRFYLKSSEEPGNNGHAWDRTATSRLKLVKLVKGVQLQTTVLRFNMILLL